MRLVLLTLLSVGAATTAHSQSTSYVSLGGTVDAVRSVARDAGGRQVSTGVAVGGAFTVHAGFFSLLADYREGNLRAAGASNERPLVEGSVTAAVHLNPWIAVGASFTACRAVESDPERWLAWGASARLELPLIGQQVTGVAEFRQGLGGEVNILNGGVRAQEGMVGLRYTLPQSSFWISLSSTLGTFAAGGRTRTLEHFGIGVGWRGP